LRAPDIRIIPHITKVDNNENISAINGLILSEDGNKLLAWYVSNYDNAYYAVYDSKTDYDSKSAQIINDYIFGDSDTDLWYPVKFANHSEMLILTSDSELKLIDLNNGEVQYKLQHPEFIKNVDILSTDHLSLRGNDFLSIWNLNDGSNSRIDKMTNSAISADKKWFVWGIEMLNIASLERIKFIPQVTPVLQTNMGIKYPAYLEFSPSDEQLLSYSRDLSHGISVWDLKSERVIATARDRRYYKIPWVNQPKNTTSSADFFSYGKNKWLEIQAFNRKQISLIDQTNKEIIDSIRYTDDFYTAMSLSPDRKSLLVATTNGKIIEIDLLSKQEKVLHQETDVDEKPFYTYSLVYSPDGKWIVAGGENSSLIVWNSNGEKQQQISLNTTSSRPLSIQAITISKNNKVAVLVDSESIYTADLNDLNTIKLLARPVDRSKDYMTTIAFDSTGNHLAVGYKNSVRIFSVDNFKHHKKELVSKIIPSLSSEVSKSGQYLLTQSDISATLWDLTIGQPIFHKDSSLNERIKLAGNDEYLIITSYENIKIVRILDQNVIFNLPSNKLYKEFGIGNFTNIIKLSQNKESLFITLADKIVVWDIASNKKIMDIKLDENMQKAQVDKLFLLKDVSKILISNGLYFSLISLVDGEVLWSNRFETKRDPDYQIKILNHNKVVIMSEENKSEEDFIQVYDLNSGNKLLEGGSKKYMIDSYTLVTDENNQPYLFHKKSNESFTRLLNWEDFSTQKEFYGLNLADYSEPLLYGSKLIVKSSNDNLAIWDFNKAVLSREIPVGKKINDYSIINNKFITVSTIEGVEIYSISEGKLIALLTNFNSSKWGVVSPRGLYDSNTPGNLNGMSWIVSDDKFTPLPIEIFLHDFFEPRLLNKLLNGSKIRDEVKIHNINRVQPLVTIDKVIQEPSNPEKARLYITVKEQSKVFKQFGKDVKIKSGLKSVKIFRDGQLVGKWQKGQHQKEKYEIVFDNIKLPQINDGSVEFSVYALNEDNIKSQTHVLKYNYKNDKKTKRNAYILSIGVNEHENKSWNLSYAVNDAVVTNKMITQVLRKQTDTFNKVIPITLVSSKNNSISKNKLATKANIKQVFFHMSGRTSDTTSEEYIDNLDQVVEIQPDDFLLISFSGHGFVDDEGMFHLFPADIGIDNDRSKIEEVLKHTITNDELANWLYQIDANEIIMILDACNSSASIDQNGFRPGPMGSRGLGQLAYDKSMRILTASQAEQVALENEQLQHGILTYSLIQEGLNQKKADFLPSDGVIDTVEWFKYGKQRVPKLYSEITSKKWLSNINHRGKVIFLGNKSERLPETLKVQQPALFDFIKQKGQASLLWQKKY